MLEWYRITPDQTNEEPVMYREDIIEIWEAKQLILKGEIKAQKREEAKKKGRSAAKKY